MNVVTFKFPGWSCSLSYLIVSLCGTWSYTWAWDGLVM